MSRKNKSSCDICEHCHPVYGSGLVKEYVRDSVFYCDHFKSLYCETTPCTTGYKKRRV